VKKYLITALVLSASLSSCFLYTHDPEKARDEATSFLNQVYKKNEIEKAYERTGEIFKKNMDAKSLAELRETLDSQYGKLEGLRAGFYVMDAGEKVIEIFYDGITVKKMSYHKVTLEGDGKSGYKVTGVTLSGVPHKYYRTQKNFKR